MKGIVTFVGTIIGLVVVSWVANLVKLTDCDFASPYRCEAVHGIGLIPVVAPVAVWFDTDKQKKEAP